jgi:hypothetical protein
MFERAKYSTPGNHTRFGHGRLHACAAQLSAVERRRIERPGQPRMGSFFAATAPGRLPAGRAEERKSAALCLAVGTRVCEAACEGAARAPTGTAKGTRRGWLRGPSRSRRDLQLVMSCFGLAPLRLLICSGGRVHARQRRPNFESASNRPSVVFSSSLPAPRSCGSSPLCSHGNSICLSSVILIAVNFGLPSVFPARGGYVPRIGMAPGRILQSIRRPFPT